MKEQSCWKPIRTPAPRFIYEEYNNQVVTPPEVPNSGAIPDHRLIIFPVCQCTIEVG